MAKNTNDKPIQADMMLEMDLDGIGTVKVHMEQDEVEAGKAIISHAVERLSPWLAAIVPWWRREFAVHTA